VKSLFSTFTHPFADSTRSFDIRVDSFGRNWIETHCHAICANVLLVRFSQRSHWLSPSPADFQWFVHGSCFRRARVLLDVWSPSPKSEQKQDGRLGCRFPFGFVTLFRLAPGAPLDSQAIVGGEVLIVGRNSGEIINEKESPPSQINVYDGSVMLMPKKSPYLLRNIGKESVELLVIEVRK